MMNKLHAFASEIRRNYMLLIMLLPATLYVLIFSYVPMAGSVIAFKQFRYSEGIFASPWVGL